MEVPSSVAASSSTGSEGVKGTQGEERLENDRRGHTRDETEDADDSREQLVSRLTSVL